MLACLIKTEGTKALVKKKNKIKQIIMKDFLTETGCIITDMTVLLSVEACGHQVRYLSQCLATITRGEIKWNTLSLLHRSAAANFRIKMRHSNSSTTCLVTSRLLSGVIVGPFP